MYSALRTAIHGVVMETAIEIEVANCCQISIPRQSRGFYSLSASKALVTHEPPEGGYSPNFIWS
jgi:hypothetical protein